ncbi:hypothetical protein MF672_036680 [Actinomadura sp. ATCC 31491]|uniref:Uncharacterized protein n=1 Tax=Actinomadura luzonensis TaxID=2805427 RepID=A0ABT0G410_9ACTN|nr:hypothetical protein [Actinomadura luzonensis]MCK2219292.1 hypothetical protein [Actinomadura luzonensis]
MTINDPMSAQTSMQTSSQPSMQLPGQLQGQLQGQAPGQTPGQMGAQGSVRTTGQALGQSRVPAEPRLDDETAALLADHTVQDCVKRVENRIRYYTQQYMDAHRERSEQAEQRSRRRPGESSSEVGILSPALPYLWFDMAAVGPFKFNGMSWEPGRIYRTGEQALLLALLWRNPLPIGGGPSAAAVMAPLFHQVRGLTININTVTAGPAMTPMPAAFGPGFFNIVPMLIPTTPAPPDGNPRLLEIHVTADVLGIGPGLPPFAAFATQWQNPENQPPFPGFPGIPPGIVQETPVRVLIYS